MDLGQNDENVEVLDTTKGFGLVYDLLAAYGFSQTKIERLEKGRGR